MPSSSNHKQQGTSTANQPVVQAIVDSLTRCFSPIVGSDEYGTGRCPSTTDTTRRHNRDGNSSSKSRRSSTTSATVDQHKPNNNNNKGGTYDADRYIHRKLEIFRTTDEECLAEFGIPHPRPTKRHKSSSSSPNRKKEKEGKEEKGGGTTSNHRRNQSANTLVYSSEDQSEEIDNITQVQLREKKRQRQQAANNSNNASGTSNSGGNLSNILNILRNPFNCLNELHELQTKNGLCFANPVHNDDWMNHEENYKYDEDTQFDEKSKMKCMDGVVPDVDESSASLDGTYCLCPRFCVLYMTESLCLP